MPFLIRFALVVAFGGALSGCFISKEPLIGADKAVFPYAEITYAEADNGKPATLIRKGDAYSLKAETSDEEALLRFAPAGDGLYVVQMEFVEDNAVRRLFALLKVDLEKKTVASYASVAPDDGVTAAGLSNCGEDTVCIKSLDGYIAYARSTIEAGREPDATYDIISLK